MNGPAVDFALTEEHLVQLLSRSEAGIHNLNPATRHGCETVREVSNADWFTHVEDEGLTTSADGAGLDDELNGLLYGHEVSGHIGIGHRQRPAGVELNPKRVKYRASTAEDVAEPHR